MVQICTHFSFLTPGLVFHDLPASLVPSIVIFLHIALWLSCKYAMSLCLWENLSGSLSTYLVYSVSRFHGRDVTSPWKRKNWKMLSFFSLYAVLCWSLLLNSLLLPTLVFSNILFLSYRPCCTFFPGSYGSGWLLLKAYCRSTRGWLAL